jgi:hypothetical protein
MLVSSLIFLTYAIASFAAPVPAPNLEKRQKSLEVIYLSTCHNSYYSDGGLRTMEYYKNTNKSQKGELSDSSTGEYSRYYILDSWSP